MKNKFNIGDILINNKREKHHDNIEIYYVIVGIEDIYTYIKRLDDTDSNKQVRYPTSNMDWFFSIVSRA